MFRILVFTSLFCFIGNQILLAQSQIKADSLKQLIKNGLAQDEEREILQQIIDHEQNMDSIIFFAEKFLILCELTSYPEGVSRGYSRIAGSYRQKGELEKALRFFFLSLENTDVPKRKGIAYAEIGSVYQQNEDFKNALVNYRKAIVIFQELQDSLRLGTSFISLGYAHYLIDQLDSSEIFLTKSSQIFETIDIEYNEYYWSYAEGNLALVIAKKGYPMEAEKRLAVVIEILDKYKDLYAISEYKIELAKIYHQSGDEKRALVMALSGTDLAIQAGYKKFIRDGSLLLAELYKIKGDYKKAFEYQSDYYAYNDSLVNADLVRQLANQRTEFEVGQKQTEVDLLQVQKENQRLVLIATAGIAVLLIILAVIIYVFYRSKSKVNQILETQKLELQTLNQTKDKFFSIISHDLRGPVSSFHGVTRLMKQLVEAGEKDALLMFADEMDKSVTQLSALLDNLLNWAMQQQGGFPNVPEKVDLKELADELSGTLSNMAKGKQIQLNTDVEDQLVVLADRNMIMTTLRNLTNNALKFTPEGGIVTIQAGTKGAHAEIRVTDTGVGIPNDKLEGLFKLQDKKSTYGTKGEKGLGLGLQLVYEFIEINHGEIMVESKEGKGTTFIVMLPLA